ncbi:MAG TPA: class I poly(R)-hydroxyalkanoic acid synthase, partial [Sphingomicrobium sp.]|nr:class I poly(R)-hydroxyalkanoic acid synthase [Sphingomicrobium sp.]
MADDTNISGAAIPTLEEWQHWTLVMGRAQQMLMEYWAEQMKTGQPMPNWSPSAFGFGTETPANDPMALMSAGAQAWAKGLETWGKMLGGVGTAPATEKKDRRFAAPEWRENPIFDTIKNSYLQISDQLLGTVDQIENIDADTREKLRFATRSFVDAMSPSNFALTNPQVLKRTMETRGENLLKGLANMLKDIAAGQLTQTKPGVFEVGRNLATTPGEVVKQTPLYQLIQYTPTTDAVLKTPVVIFPPWINRFYILDLSPEKSFVKWCVDNGVTLFMVSWKSADESIADATLDDYVLKGQIDAIDTV